jgi:predicted Zn-dependent protease
MARAAAKGRKRPQPDARGPRKRGRRQLSATEQTLFFSRIRTHAKWAYVLLAVLFAGTFAFLGVGSGNSDLTSLFTGIFNGGSGGPSISSALKKTNDHPQDAKAWRELATAYQAKEGHLEDAISALATYTSLRPKDAQALVDLGSLQLTDAGNLAQIANAAQINEQEAYAPTSFQPASTTPLGKAFAQDPVLSAVQGRASTARSDAASRAGTAYGQAVNTYQQLTKLKPNDSTAWLSLDQAAEQAGDSKTAVLALKKVAKLEPDQAAQIKARIKTIQGSAGG